MSDPYQNLIDRLVRDEPNCGYSDRLLPRLTDAQIGAVLAHEPDLLCDAVVCDSWAKHLATILRENTGHDLEFRVTGLLISALNTEVRQYLLREVNIACEQREIQRDQLAEAYRTREIEAVATVEGI